MGILSDASKTIVRAGDILGTRFAQATANGVRSPDFKEGFVITPVRDQKAVPEDAVKLVGSLMPHVPFNYGGELRETRDYYPGNSEPVVHVLGTKETDLVVKGRFYAKRFHEAAYYRVPIELANRLDTVRLKGELVMLSLGEWRRYAFLTKTQFELKNLGDISYELTFSIVGFRMPRTSQVIKEIKSLPFTINDQLIDGAAQFMASYSTAPESTPASLVTVLNDAVTEVATAISTVTNYVDDVVSTAEDVTKTYARALGAIRYAGIKLQQFRRRIGGIANSAAIMSESTFSMATKYLISSHFSNALSASLTLSAFMEQLRARFKGISDSLPLARHLVRAGETLQSISVRWYGVSEQWKKIYDHNKLTSTVLTVGSVLEIPKL